MFTFYEYPKCSTCRRAKAELKELGADFEAIDITLDTPKADQKEAIDQLVDLGFVRILTHGSSENNDIFENVDHLKELVDYANGRIEIMIGGGVTADNYQELIEKTGAQAAHGTKIC